MILIFLVIYSLLLFRSMDCDSFICQICTDYSTPNFRRLCRHITLLHAGIKFKCNINSCKKHFSYTRGYVRHIKLNTVGFGKSIGKVMLNRLLFCEENMGGLPVDNSDIISDVDDHNNLNEGNFSGDIIIHEDNTDIDFENIVAMFLLKLQELKKTSSSACEFVAEEMSTLVKVICTSQMQYLQKYQLSDPELDLFFNSMPNNLLKSSLEKFRF